jgi:pantothenate kinase-related protein Tda10
LEREALELAAVPEEEEVVVVVMEGAAVMVVMADSVAMEVMADSVGTEAEVLACAKLRYHRVKLFHLQDIHHRISHLFVSHCSPIPLLTAIKSNTEKIV